MKTKTDSELVLEFCVELFLILISFMASAAFGVVFRIPNRDLWCAGLGGALTRTLLIVLAPVIPSRLIYITVAALAAGLYAEAMATVRRDPSTYYIYPAIMMNLGMRMRNRLEKRRALSPLKERKRWMDCTRNDVHASGRPGEMACHVLPGEPTTPIR